MQAHRQGLLLPAAGASSCAEDISARRRALLTEAGLLDARRCGLAAAAPGHPAAYDPAFVLPFASQVQPCIHTSTVSSQFTLCVGSHSGPAPAASNASIGFPLRAIFYFDSTSGARAHLQALETGVISLEQLVASGLLALSLRSLSAADAVVRCATEYHVCFQVGFQCSLLPRVLSCSLTNALPRAEARASH